MSQESILTLGIKTKKALRDLNNFNSKINSVGKSVSLRLSAPLLALEGVAIKTFAEMEKGLTDITNLADKGQGFAEFSNQMKETQEEAIEMGFTIDDVNKSLFDTVSALGQGQTALETYEQAQKLARGGNAELSQTVDGLTSVINAYGREVTNASDVANAFFTAQKQGKTTVAELASNIGKVAPVAKSAGIGFKELLATMSEMTLGGLSTDEATTSLRATISALIKPTKEAEQILKDLGVPVGALELKQKGLGFALKQLSKAQRENADIIAQAIPNIRALTGVTSFNDEKLKHLQETQNLINEDIKNGTGLNEAYTDAMNDLSNIFKATTGSLKTLANTFGELFVEGFEVKDFLKEMGEEIKNLKKYVEDMTPAQKDTALWVAGLATGLPPATVAVTGLAMAINSVASATKIMNLAMLKNPFVLTAVAGLYAGSELYDMLNKDVEKAKELSASIKELMQEQKNNEKLKMIEDKEWAKMAGEFDKFLESEMKPSIELEAYFSDSSLKELDDFITEGLANSDMVNLFLDNDLDDLEKKTRDEAQDIEPAVKKGSIEALQQENPQVKIQNKQLKEQKKANKYLADIADNQNSDTVGDF